MTIFNSAPPVIEDTSASAPVPFGVGHNGGPPLTDDGYGWRLRCWRQAQKKAWKSPPREVVLMRVRRAKELGMTYREYTLEILERGRYL